MNLLQYVQFKGSRYLSNSEAQTFGIDTNKGWLKRYGEMELSQDKINEAVRKIIKSPSQHKTHKSHMANLLVITDEILADDKYLYLMKDSNNSLKVGISKNPIRRAQELQQNSGYKVTCVGIWKTQSFARVAEKKVLKSLSFHSSQGEWFRPDSINHLDVEDSIGCSFTRLSTDGLFNEVDSHEPLSKQDIPLIKTEISFKEYISRRGSNALSKGESEILGITYLSKGWYRKNKDKLIHPNIIDECLEAIQSSSTVQEKVKIRVKHFWKHNPEFIL